MNTSGHEPAICGADLPPVGGAYALVIEVRRPVRLVIRGNRFRLGPGEYLYCGSARGPGGIRARVERHMRRDKALHWHIDQLTAVGRVRGVVVAPGGSECDLFERFAGLQRSRIPVPGFGASDCRRCPAHLMGVDDLILRMPELALEPTESLLLDSPPGGTKGKAP
jgi:Uri superfamily endonuclease